MRQFLLIAGLLFSTQAIAQTGIGTSTPDASAKLDVFSTTKGFLPPRMTCSQRTGISNPSAGLIVYQTDGTVGLYYHNGSGWIYVINSSTNVVSLMKCSQVSDNGSVLRHSMNNKRILNVKMGPGGKI